MTAISGSPSTAANRTRRISSTSWARASGSTPTITSDAVSETTIISEPGNRCISVGHKSEISASMLRALKDTGVEHVSTRSIGVNHIDLHAAARLGITVENAAYAPDGVADYTADADPDGDPRRHRDPQRCERQATSGCAVSEAGSCAT